MDTAPAELLTGPDATFDVLERSQHLAALDASLDAVRRTSEGRLVFVGGEAGVGKTTLLRGFHHRHPDTRCLWGRCDPLFTPRPLGPLIDVAEDIGRGFQELVRGAARPDDVARALVRELGSRGPSLVVLEDMHWGDDATFDVLKLLGRRTGSFSALVLVSYRDDELDKGHPLRIVLGDLGTTPAVSRLRVEPLSREAVATLAEPHGMDADELYRRTTGNPFFVTEVLASGAGDIPETVRDAVLARAARLGAGARAVLEAVAISPPLAELWLLEELVGDALDDIEQCLDSGMLIAVGGGVAFRHELARLAIEEAVPPNRLLKLHRVALSVLEQRQGRLDLARLVHHADAADDADALARYAPEAAAGAVSFGAHREAAAYYKRALRFIDDVPSREIAELLEIYAHECYLTDQFENALGAGERALDFYRRSGLRYEEGRALRGLSNHLWCMGRSVEAGARGRDAVAVLEEFEPGIDLGLAYSNLSRLAMNSEDAEGAEIWGARALELARGLDDIETELHALNNLGTMELHLGKESGLSKLDRSIALARSAGLDEHVGRAYVNMGWAITRTRAFHLADRIAAGIEYATERDIYLWRLYLLVLQGHLDLHQGRWDAAADAMTHVLADPRDSPMLRVFGLAGLGLIRARRGDPGVWPALDEGWELALRFGELQAIAPIAAARAEAGWYEGRTDVVADATHAALDLAESVGASWVIGELSYWRRRAGIDEAIRPGAAEPYALMARGEWQRAAELWTEIGCPYETALALMDADDDDALRHALEMFHEFGAAPAAAAVAQRLRERGVRGVRRGPRAATRENPAHLTAREMEVLPLIVEGLSNSDIAQRLSLSVKTVDNHVSSILRKLGVDTRRQVAVEAARLGITKDR